MNNQNQQPNMNPDETAAALSFATMLSEQLMPKDQPETTEPLLEAPQVAPGSEETLDLEEDTLKEENDTKIADLENQLNDLREEMKEIKEMLSQGEKEEKAEEAKETKEEK